MRVSWFGLLACTVALAACSGDSEQCADGKDNDDNGLVDCADPACSAGTACAPNGMVCSGDLTCSTCSGNGGAPEPGGETSCSDGKDNDCDGAVDCADPDCAGATCAGPGGSSALGSIRVASIQYPVMGTRYSGFQEQNVIVFEVLDDAGRPYPAGLTVSFSHVSEGGSYVGLTPVCGPGPFPTCTATATTDSAGRATVLLTAGRRFALLAVRATASASGVEVTALADDIAVVGVKPNGAHIGLDCRPWNVPALTEHDCMVSKYAGPGATVDCVLTLADRHGVLVGMPTLAAFWSEAGATGYPVLSSPYVPGGTPEEQATMGQALGQVSVRGQPLPWDVAPFAGEYGLLVDFGCEPRFANPRDGLVTVIALVAGEEGFVDLNSNGQYDPDEPFVDIGEPFVDANDNGVHDPAEPFQDLNEDGVYTGPNGTWDADTILWTQTRIVYTGQPAYLRSGGLEEYSRLFDDGSPPFPTLPAASFLGGKMYGVYYADENFNPLSGLAQYVAGTAADIARVKLSGEPGDADPLGAVFRLLYCDATDANCAYGPAASACTTIPCHVVPDVSGFAYGTFFNLVVGCSPGNPGSDIAFVEANLNGVGSALSVSGVCP